MKRKKVSFRFVSKKERNFILDREIKRYQKTELNYYLSVWFGKNTVHNYPYKWFNMIKQYIVKIYYKSIRLVVHFVS